MHCFMESECIFNEVSEHFLVWTGLKIVYTHDEVDVVQNLIFYIESAYKVAVSTIMLF